MAEALFYGGLDEPVVCPEHLRFVPCRVCPLGCEQFSSDAVVVERARLFQGSDPSVACCVSNGHEQLPAVVAGVWDASAVNGRPARDATYCLRCAVLLEFAGQFIPERALVSLDSLVVQRRYAETQLVFAESKTLRMVTDV